MTQSDFAAFRCMFGCRWVSFNEQPGFVFNEKMHLYIESDEAHARRIQGMFKLYKTSLEGETNNEKKNGTAEGVKRAS